MSPLLQLLLGAAVLLSGFCVCACVNKEQHPELFLPATTMTEMLHNQAASKPDFFRRRPTWRRRLSTSTFDRLTPASYKASVMVFSTSPRISSAAAYSLWWTNDLSWNMVASMSQARRREALRTAKRNMKIKSLAKASPHAAVPLIANTSGLSPSE